MNHGLVAARGFNPVYRRGEDRWRSRSEAALLFCLLEIQVSARVFRRFLESKYSVDQLQLPTRPSRHRQNSHAYTAPKAR